MATHDITLFVNGDRAELTVDSRTLLVHALRDQLGYTGPKVGCESGKCGACTVHLDGEAVKSCTTLAVQADGSEVTTVEEVADEGLHLVQERLREEHGVQCGYCTPGMVMTATAVIADESTPSTSRSEIRTALKGNVCRCTGYQNVVDAVASAAETIANGDREGNPRRSADLTSADSPTEAGD